MTTLTRETAQIVVTPLWHDSQGRVTRTTWVANLAERGDDTDEHLTACQHSHGHETQAAAAECGRKMWRAL